MDMSIKKYETENRLRLIRNEKRMTQVDFAHATGIGQFVINRPRSSSPAHD